MRSASKEHRESEGFEHYLRTMARFHTYSANNVAMILAQRPEKTRVAGYRAWQSLGNQVRKGERGIVVFVPHCRRVPKEMEAEERTEEGEPAQGDTPSVVTGFGLGAVFDVAQTDGEALE